MLRRVKSTSSMVSPASLSPSTRKSTPCPPKPEKLRCVCWFMAYENSTPGSSCCKRSCTFVASSFARSFELMTRVCIGVSFRNFGVRVPVTTTSPRSNLRLMESRYASYAKESLTDGIAAVMPPFRSIRPFVTTSSIMPAATAGCHAAPAISMENNICVFISSLSSIS